MSETGIVILWTGAEFRALLVEGGRLSGCVSTEEGIGSLVPGQHAEVVSRHCGAWLARAPDCTLALVGAVGSREGWRTTPYLQCPAGARDIARHLTPIGLRSGHVALLFPGLVCGGADHAAEDLVRGEELLALGTGLCDAVVCVPGAHSKWIAVENGRVTRFRTYVTGELQDLLSHHSSLARAAAEPADAAGFERGLAASAQPHAPSDALVPPFLAPVAAAGRPGGGLLARLFSAQAQAAAGRMNARQLLPYLSGLLIGEEVGCALREFGSPGRVVLVADPARASAYRRALNLRGVAADLRSPDACLVAGVGATLRESTTSSVSGVGLLWPHWAG